MTTIDKIDLSRIIEIAIESGYQPLNPSTLEGMLENAKNETMLLRFAYRIAKELES